MNWPLLSAREAFRRFPHQLRFFILALMTIAFVAPTWHVCMLGGHTEHEGKSHHGKVAAQVAQVSADGTRQALICYCAPSAGHSKYPDFQGAKLTSLPGNHEHPNCLALLLQGMPAVLAFSPDFSFSTSPLKVVYVRAVASFNSRFFALYNGRAPPVFL